MAEFNGIPLDEMQWSEPAAVSFFQGINANNIHLYFMASPFCDASSNNKWLEVRARHDASLNATLASRKLLENELLAQKTNGIGYFVQDGPAENSPDMNPVWVIRKVNLGSEEAQCIEGTYYAIGECIYQAPSIKDVLQCKLLSITDLLSKIYKVAGEMYEFDSSTGYSYSKEVQASDDAAKTSQVQPTPLGGGTPKPESSQPKTISDSSSLLYQPPPPPQQQQNKNHKSSSSDLRGQASLIESVFLSDQFSEEYMDVNPLKVIPASFAFSTSHAHAKAQQQQSKQMQKDQNHLQQPQWQQHSQDTLMSTDSADLSVVGTPMTTATDLTDGGRLFRKVSRGDGTIAAVKPKPSRKKSRIDGIQ